MVTLRGHFIVRLLVCVLLTWAAADLCVPQLCSAESAAWGAQAGTEYGGDHDDCFCCCSHTDFTPLIVVLVSTSAPDVVDARPAAALAAGIPRSLYHPPLHA